MTGFLRRRNQRGGSIAQILGLLAVAIPAVLIVSCGPSPGTRNETGMSASRDQLYQEGHRLYMTRSYDSAEVVLSNVVSMDSSFVDALADLGMLHYELAIADRAEGSKTRTRNLRDSRNYLARVEELGTPDEGVYERLCEISVTLGDDRGFLKYARKSADRFPFERQYYNLGLAYFGVGEYQNVVRTQKEAIEKFKQSPYLGGYYRQLGRAYMKVDRDQTAQRTLEAGLSAVDARLAVASNDRDAVKRLTDDRIAILQLLRKLYQTYHFDDKLKSVERRLSEVGALQ